MDLVLVELIKERDGLLKEVEILNEMINKREIASNFHNSNNRISAPITASEKGYPIKGSLTDKVAYILKREDRFLHNRELAKYIIAEEGIVGEKDEKWYGAKISPLLSKLRTDNQIINIKPTKNNLNVFWGSKKWLNEDGSVIEKHLYKIDEIAGQNKIDF